jgi:hypothetical protein
MASRSDTKVRRLLRAGNDEVAIFVELAEVVGLQARPGFILSLVHADAPDM